MLVTHLDPAPQTCGPTVGHLLKAHLSNKCYSSPPVLLQPVCVPEQELPIRPLAPSGKPGEEGEGREESLAVAMVILHLSRSVGRPFHCEPPAKAWREAELSWAGRRGGEEDSSHWGGGVREKKGWGSGWGTLGLGQPGREPAPPDAGTASLQPGVGKDACRS